MSDSTQQADPRAPSETKATARGRRISPLGRGLLVASVLLMVLGLGLMAYAWLRPAPEPAAGPAAGEGLAVPLAGLDAVEGGVARALEPGEDPLRAWSPAIFRLGFSFFAGFSIAYAALAFLKISILAAGVVLLGLFGLQYAGVINVNWTAIQGHYETLAGWIGEQTNSFGAFIQGYLPSTAMGTLGLVTGFRRR